MFRIMQKFKKPNAGESHWNAGTDVGYAAGTGVGAGVGCKVVGSDVGRLVVGIVTISIARFINYIIKSSSYICLPIYLLGLSS